MTASTAVVAFSLDAKAFETLVPKQEIQALRSHLRARLERRLDQLEQSKTITTGATLRSKVGLTACRRTPQAGSCWQPDGNPLFFPLLQAMVFAQSSTAAMRSAFADPGRLMGDADPFAELRQVLRDDSASGGTQDVAVTSRSKSTSFSSKLEPLEAASSDPSFTRLQNIMQRRGSVSPRRDVGHGGPLPPLGHKVVHVPKEMADAQTRAVSSSLPVSGVDGAGSPRGQNARGAPKFSFPDGSGGPGGDFGNEDSSYTGVKLPLALRGAVSEALETLYGAKGAEGVT